jgi:hypothetical protein
MVQMLWKKPDTTPRKRAFRVAGTEPMIFDKETLAKTTYPLVVELRPRIVLNSTIYINGLQKSPKIRARLQCFSNLILQPGDGIKMIIVLRIMILNSLHLLKVSYYCVADPSANLLLEL